MIDASLRLDDGRTLAYTDIGTAASPVVMYFHGAPGSRLDLLPATDALCALDARVVTPDRPGIGCSSRRPGRRVEDWPADAAALADHLGVERFAVLGASWGASYALACAALLPDRVTGAGVLCGGTDFAWSGAWDGFDDDEASVIRAGDERAATAWCEARYGRRGGVWLNARLASVCATEARARTGGRCSRPSITPAFRTGP